LKTLLTLSSEQGIDIPWERILSAGSDIQYASHKSFDYIIDIENVHSAEKPIVSLICLYVYKYTCYGLLSVIFEKCIFAVKVAEKPIVDIVLALYL